MNTRLRTSSWSDSRTARLLIALCLIILGQFVIQLPPAEASETPYPYPASPPNFMTDHGEFSKARGSIGIVPTLVIYGTFTDVTELKAVSAASIERDMFGLGLTGTIRNYFWESSVGHVNIVPATETSGTQNNGVVQVNLGDFDVFEALGNFPAQGKRVLQAADPFVDFASFDKDHDGNLTVNELLIISVKSSIDATPNTAWDKFRPNNCGITDGIASGTKLDGMNASTARWVNVATATNQMTIAHEIAHSLLGFNPDNRYVAGSFDIMGGTCSRPKRNFWQPNIYNKAHWGWVRQPEVVTGDRYVDFNGDLSQAFPSAQLLYDPAHGTSEYFLIEARKLPKYDTDASDSGLVIWQIDESKFGTSAGPYTLVTPPTTVPPQSGTLNDDAWDPADSQTTSRTMTGRWKDGTTARVAVRAIHNNGKGTYRAWLDVRGPGILVDAWRTPAQSSPAGRQVMVNFPVRNTGEATDTFEFGLASVPAGWTQVKQVRTLAAGQSATATVRMNIPATARPGNYVLAAAGQSTTSVTYRATDGSTRAYRTQSTDIGIPITVLPTVDLATSMTVSPAQPFAGEGLSFTTTVTNKGPNTATNVALTDLLPTNATLKALVASQGSCSSVVTPARCALSSIPAGGSATVTATVTPLTGGAVTNSVDVRASEPDPVLGNNASAKTITVAERAATQWSGPSAGLPLLASTVSFADVNNGWAVGANGSIARTKDGGTTWQQLNSGTTATLRDVEFIDANNGWAVGGNAPVILHTTDGGETWVEQPTDFTSERGLLTAVDFVDNLTGWAVGAGTSGGVVLHTTDGGATWTTTAKDVADTNHYADVVATDALHAWAVGPASIHGTAVVATADGGTTWTETYLPRPTDLPWGIAMAANNTDGLIVGDNGLVLATHDGGKTWTDVPSGTTNRLYRVAYPAQGHAWAVGTYGTVLATTNGGTTWARQMTGTTEDLTGVSFVDAQHGWAVGLGTVLAGT